MNRVGKEVIKKIKKLGIKYECIKIDPEFADTLQFCKKYGFPMERSCNTIIVGSKKEPKSFCACVVLATTRLDVNNCVRKLMRVPKVSFASVEEMKKLTGMEVGGVTVFALPDDMPVYVDHRIMKLEWVILGGGGRDTKIKIDPLIFKKLNTKITSDLARCQ